MQPGRRRDAVIGVAAGHWAASKIGYNVLENEIAEKLGAVVHIEPGRKGAGRVVIRYSTLEQLDGIVSRLGVTRQ